MQGFMILAIIGTEILIIDKKLDKRTDGLKVELLYHTLL